MVPDEKVKLGNTDKLKKWWGSHGATFQILCLIIGLVVINILLFVFVFRPSYQKINNELIVISTLTLPNQIWEFLKSDGFRVVTTLFLLPIFTLFISDRFKVKERMEENILKRNEEKKQIVYNAIKQTQNNWADITNLSSSLRYYSGEIPIEDIRLGLDNYSVKLREVKNTWNLVFDKLSEFQTSVEYVKLLEKPIYVFYSFVSTVAQHVHEDSLNYRIDKNKEPSTKDIIDKVSYQHVPRKDTLKHPFFFNKELIKYQYTLGVVQTTINNIFYNSILTILKNYVDYVFGDVKEHNVASDSIIDNLDNLERLYVDLVEIEGEYNPVFSSILFPIENIQCEGGNSNENQCKENCRKIQRLFDSGVERLKYPNKKREKKIVYDELRKCPEFKKLYKLHSDMGHHKRMYAISFPYSEKCMEELVKYLDFQEAARDLIEQAEGMIFNIYSEKNFSLTYPFIWQKDNSKNNFNILKSVSIALFNILQKFLDKDYCSKYGILSYKNVLCGYIGYKKINKDYIYPNNNFLNKYKNEIERNLKPKEIDKDGFRVSSICNERKDTSDVSEPCYKDRKLIINQQDAYFLELTVSKHYYEDHKEYIDKTMDSFKLS